LQFKSKFGLFPFDHPVDEQRAYATIDATLSLRTEDYRWTAELIGRNLTDKYALLRSGDTPSTGGGPARPTGSSRTESAIRSCRARWPCASPATTSDRPFSSASAC